MVHSEGGWSTPELVIRGIACEPALMADGRLLYFVLSDRTGHYDAGVWVCQRFAMR